MNAKELKEKRQTLRNNATASECILWKRLKGRQVDGLKFRRQHSVGEYVMDFYCPEIKLCVELDGYGHYTVGGLERDAERTKFINGYGIHVMRFENEVVRTNVEYVVERILEYRSRIIK